MTECQHEWWVMNGKQTYCRKCLVIATELLEEVQAENKALRERVRKWEEFTREWAEDASPATEAKEG